MQRNNKEPIDVVADYLKLLWQHTVNNMKRVLGAICIDVLPFKVVLTVPAIWRSYAYARMRQAAKIAGILDERLGGETTLQLATEPEAAALAILDQFKDAARFKASSMFMLYRFSKLRNNIAR
jgi:molecular chaperone DnaK (HSP70)